MYRKTYVEIDENILENNAREIVNKYPDYKYYFGVVKNNAYHHGIKVINSLIAGGVNYLAVSSLEEALDARKYNIDIPILILEPIDLDFIDDAINNNITITVDSLDYLKKLKNLELISQVKIHLKIDSGMNRLGFKLKNEVNKAWVIFRDNKKMYLEGIYSHFATSGRSDYHYDLQVKNFLEITSGIDLKNIPIVHFDRSLTFVSHKKLDFVNGVRLGIVLFGFSDSTKVSKNIKGKLRELKRQIYLKHHHISNSILTNDLNLKTAFKLYSEVISLRKVQKGEYVGYNASYKVKEDSYIATISIGYADGVTKKFGYVVINNNKYKIIGDSMDMIMVLVDKSVKYQDKVEIFGDTISIRGLSNRLGINAYHLFNEISNRVPRIHKNEDEEIEIKY